MPLRNIYIFFVVLVLSLFCLFNFSLRQRVVHYVFRTIEKESLYEKPATAIYEGALRGMAESIDDEPYTSYLPPVEERDYNNELQGKVAGIGILPLRKELNGEELSFIPLSNAPASKAGLRFGDRIVAVDDEKVKDLPLWQLLNKLRGEENTTVVLTVRPREQYPLWQEKQSDKTSKQSDKTTKTAKADKTDKTNKADKTAKNAKTGNDTKTADKNQTSQKESDSGLKKITITRALFRQDIVFGDRRNSDGSWEYRLESDPEIGYIGVSQFTDATVTEFYSALEQLQTQKVDRLIIDFRGNPGGFLPAAVGICDGFLQEGQDIVTVKYRDGRVKSRHTASGNMPHANFKVAILIDEESASASEIVAACLQDHGRATIVGTRSYGKGTIQQLFPLPCQMGLLRLTDASFWRPSNQPLHHYADSKPEDDWGVKPDSGSDIPLDGFQWGVMHLCRNLRQLLPPSERDQALSIQMKEIDACLKSLSLDEESDRKELENYLGYSTEEDELQRTKRETPVNEETEQAPKKDSEHYKPAGKSPCYDPQLDRAVECLKQK